MNYIKFRQDWYNKFKHISYDDDEHKYMSGDKRLTSVTQLIGKFKPPFDTEYWSKRKAKERGITQEAMKNEWNEIKNKGLQIGNTIHDYIEKRYEQFVIEPRIDSVEKYLEDTKDDIEAYWLGRA